MKKLSITELRKLVQSKQLSAKVVSINDLREKEYEGHALDSREKQALHNYERFRLQELNKHLDDQDFNKVYQMIQVMANLRPFEDFLDDKLLSM